MIRSLAIAGLSSLLLLPCGCEQAPEVVSYEIPTAVPEALKTEQDRMLATMVPRGDDVWFYKLTGQQSAVESVADAFDSFVASVDYDDDGPNLKDLPEGWRRGGQRAFRFATINVPSITADGEEGNQLDLSVSKLSKQDDYDAMVAMNVNRWRGQLGLPPSEESLAGAQSMDLDNADGQSYRVDLLGESSGGGPPMMPRGGPPMMPGGFQDGDQMSAGNDSPPSSDEASERESLAASPPEQTNNQPPNNQPPNNQPPNNQSSENQSPVQFETPDGWRPGRTSSMRLAAFDVGPEESAAEITVIPAGGDLRSNVARWIGQIISATPDDEVVDQAMADATPVSVDGRQGQRFYLTGDDSAATAIDAAVIDLGDGFSLFVKMTGPPATVSDQKDRIGAFLDSMKINL